MQIHGDSGIISTPLQSGATFRRSSALSIANSTLTIVIFNSESFDIQGEYNNTTGRFTCTEAGIYLCTGTIGWLQFVADKNYWFYVYKNAANVLETQVQFPTSGNLATQNIAHAERCAAGDILDFRVLHDTGSAKSIQIGTQWPKASIVKIA